MTISVGIFQILFPLKKHANLDCNAGVPVNHEGNFKDLLACLFLRLIFIVFT